MKRGFTVVELMVVIVVIAAMIAFVVGSYDSSQKRSYDSQARNLAAAVKSGAERYYNTNNEYPLASLLYGGTPTGSVPASYTTAATTLNVPTGNINSDKAKLIPCNAGSCNTTDVTKVYYLTKDTAANVSNVNYTVGSCTYTLGAADAGGLAFLIAFYSYTDSKWLVATSNNGTTSTSNTTTCPFTTL